MNGIARALLVAATFATGCGSSGATATLGGAVSGTLNLTEVTAASTSREPNGGLDQWNFFMLGANSQDARSLSVALYFTGAVETGIFTEVDGSGGPSTVQLKQVTGSGSAASNDEWNLPQQPIPGSQPEYVFALTITSTGDGTLENNGVVTDWNQLHGTLTATLVPASSNASATSGNVNVSATF